MRISMTEAKTQLPKLAKLAQNGVDVFLIDDGKPSFQLVPISWSPLPVEERMKVFEKVRQRGRDKGPANFETDAAHSQDFLYGDDGLPA